MYINEEEIVNHISAKPFHLISEAAEELGVEVYVIGGYVRDIFLNRPSKDIDVVAVGSGIELAKRVAKKIGRGAYLSVFKNFGTAQVKAGDLELEFVGQAFTAVRTTPFSPVSRSSYFSSRPETPALSTLVNPSTDARNCPWGYHRLES